jgi:hypothetical protein
VTKKSLTIVLLLVTFLATQSLPAHPRDEKTTKTEKKCLMMEKCEGKTKCGEACRQHHGNMTVKAGNTMNKKAGCCATQGKVIEKNEEKKKD